VWVSWRGREKGEGGEINGAVWGGRIKEWERKGEEVWKRQVDVRVLDERLSCMCPVVPVVGGECAKGRGCG
jgi:hypothetical protein